MLRHLLAFAVVLSVPAFPASGQPGQWLRQSREPIELPSGSRVEFSTMPSKALGGTGEFSIFFPPSYGDGDKRYPVVYFLHGLFNDHTSWTLDHEGDIDGLIDASMAKGTLPEMVLVHPNGGRSFYTNTHDGSVRYEDFVVDELPAHVEANYRVLSGRAHRAISGTSMGGYGALKIAMRHPDRYIAVAAHSPIVFPVDNPLDVSGGNGGGRQFEYIREVFAVVYGRPFDQTYFDENNPLKLAARSNLNELGIYFDYGTEDRYADAIGLGRGLEKLAQELEARKVPHQFEIHEGEPHGWALVFAHIPESLAFIARYFVGGG
ncbi:MAG TPA: alpha/beta hydrolase family protein [Vicinamibacteria bacterium]|nr:alpha/beta hydrolase family protein [Vicinamibacteria bacterium]